MKYIVKLFFNLCFTILFLSINSTTSNATNNIIEANDTTAQVICNIIGYIWGIGGPLMTVVIIGASLLAIFGRMPWPALFALGVFCGVFFGAKAIIMKVIPNLSPEVENTLKNCGTNK